jgi:hypothetical protein
VKDFWGKLSKILLFCLVLLIPTQLGKHFWFNWSSVLGIRVDYFSPTVYLIDLVFLVWMIINCLGQNKRKIRFNFSLLLVLIFIGLNVLVSVNKWLAFYKWIRLGELVYFGFWVFKNKKVVGNVLIKVIPYWVIVESFLALGQISKGGSLNGLWWFLGERRFDFNTIGIAQMSVADMGLVRAYGTFSHPNSLAAFLLVSLVWWIKTKPFNLLTNLGQLPLKTGTVLEKIKFNNVVWWGVFWLGLVGIFLAGSRTIWLLTLGVIVFWFWQSKYKLKEKIKFGLLVVGLLLILFKIIDFNYPLKNFLGGWDENGMIKRGQLNLAAVEMIGESPWVGVGLGNYLVKLPEFLRNNHIFWLQPVHNIFLLLVSEIGILGLIGVVWLLAKKIKWEILDKWSWIILGVIFVSGMVDHYWFTLPQNMWLLALVLGLI